MKFNILQAGLTLFVSGCSLLCAAQPLARADSPALKVGDTWVVQSSDGRTGEKKPDLRLTVTEVTADNIIMESGKTRRTFTRDWNIVEIKSGETVTFSAKPNWTFYQFPLEVGKKWESQWETTDSRQTIRWQGKSQVEAVESVTVPAGTFQAFKIRFEGTSNGQVQGYGWTGFRKETVWYSPDAKRAVKSEWEYRATGTGWATYSVEVNELKSFKLAQ
jgi:hypothetical protein